MGHCFNRYGMFFKLIKIVECLKYKMIFICRHCSETVRHNNIISKHPNQRYLKVPATLLCQEVVSSWFGQKNTSVSDFPTKISNFRQKINHCRRPSYHRRRRRRRRWRWRRRRQQQRRLVMCQPSSWHGLTRWVTDDLITEPMQQRINWKPRTPADKNIRADTLDEFRTH